MAEESLTLLKNQNQTLPIAFTGARKTILITGSAGNSRRIMSGGWFVDWRKVGDSFCLANQRFCF